MENKRKNSIINVALAGMIGVSVTLGTLLMVSPKLKAKILTIGSSGDRLTGAYTNSEESTNTWDISINEDGSVMATLSEDGILTISGTGEMKYWYSDSENDWHSSDNKTKVKEVVIGEGISNIGSCAFYGCSTLTSVEMQEGLTSIGDYAFNGCSNLTDIEIPEGVITIGMGAFIECSSITNIEIPETVTSIECAAFNWCSNLKNVKISGKIKSIEGATFSQCTSLEKIELPEEVTSIGDYAFDGCSSLKSIKILKGLTSIGNWAFYGCSSLEKVEVLEGVTNIGDYAFGGCSSLISVESLKGATNIGAWSFYECSSLERVEALEGITSIGESAFYLCSSLTSIGLSEGVTSIGNFAFSGCSSLTSIEIPQGVTNIGDLAFNGCSGLTSIKIPEGVTSIGCGAFDSCSSLTSIELPQGVTSIGKEAFIGCSSLVSIKLPEGITSIETYVFAECRSLTNIEIPSSVTSIGYGAFYFCSSLTSIGLSEGVTSIGELAFCQCSSLTSIEIPSSVTSIETNAFLYCTSLTNIEIPEGVISLGDNAFYGCGELTNLEIPESVTSIGSEVFAGCRIIKLLDMNDEIELPNILKRAQDENDILYSSVAIELTNCTFEENNIKINDGMQYARVQIVDGALKGLIYEFYYKSWDISKDENSIVTAELLEDGTLVISGIGEMNVYKYGSTPWGSQSYKIKKVCIEEGVTNIQSYIFAYFDNLVTVEIPSSVTTIEDNPFMRCTNLTEIKIDDNNVTYKFEDGIIYSRDDKKIITYLATNKENEYTIPEGITSIGTSAFSGCIELENVIIPEGVNYIGCSAFEFCSNLESIEIPNSVTSIEYGAFYNCVNLTSIELPSKLTYIPSNLFNRCMSLKELIISNKVTSIGENAFAECDNLTIICKSGSVAENYAKENNINYQLDEEGPTITFMTDWTSSAMKNAWVYVTETDNLAGINNESLRYLWSTQSENVTKEQITNPYKEGEKLEIKDVTGTYYLWIYAEDKVGNETIERGYKYILDNSAPIAEVSYSTTDPTNQNVTVTIKADERIQEVDGWNLSSNGQELTKEYTENTSEEGEDVTVKNSLENTTTVNIKVTNIDQIAPTLTVTAEVTSDTITVKSEAIDEKSGINENSYKYYIREEEEDYGESVESGTTYTFSNLKSETKYIIMVEVSDKAGNIVRTAIDATTQKSDKITSTTREIDEEKQTIKEISSKTTVEEIKKSLQNDMAYEIQDQEGNIVSEDTKVGTGYKIKMENNKIYTLIVTGDSTGDGEADIKDILAINRHRLNKSNLKGEYLEAADVNGDGQADIKDIFQINKLRLGI